MHCATTDVPGTTGTATTGAATHDAHGGLAAAGRHADTQMYRAKNGRSLPDR